MSANELAPGTRLGAYRILGTLGRGGMGVVYNGLEAATGRPVAIKVLARHLAGDEAAARRFRREGQAATLVHPNIATLFFAGEVQGTSFLVFELVPGGTLKKLVETRQRLPWREAVALGVGIARALEAIHGAGLVHRDLKPENVLLDARGTPKVTDFGLVGKAREAELTATGGLTKSGDIMGTLEFMAPEQADGRKVDWRADLYSLGATLYQMLTGAPPFRGQGFEIIRRILLEQPASTRAAVPEIPPALDRLVLRLLAKEPAERGESAAAITAALEALLADKKPEPSPLAFRLVLLALVAVTVALVTVLVVRTPVAPPSPPPPPPPVAPVVAAPHDDWPPPRPAGLPETTRAILATPLTQLTHFYGSYRWKPGWYVSSLAVSPDGERALTTGAKCVMLWDLTTGEPLRTFVGHTGDVVASAFSPDGHLGASGAKDGTIRVWDLESGALVRLIQSVQVRAVYSVAWVGKRIFSGDDDGAVRIWNAETGDPVATLRGHTAPVTAIDVSLDADRCVSGDEKGGLKVWDVTLGRSSREFFDDKAMTVHAVAILPGDRRFLTASHDGKLKLWDANEPLALREWGHPDAVWSVALSRDGKRALTGSADSVVRLFDLESPEPDPIRSFRDETVRNPGPANQVHAVAFAGAGRVLSGSVDGTLRLWDMESRTEISHRVPHEGYVNSVALAPGKRLVSASADGRVAVWDLERATLLNESRVCDRNDDGLYADASPGARFAVAGVPNGLYVFDPIAFDSHVVDAPPVRAVAVLADGRALAGGVDGSLRLTDSRLDHFENAMEGHVGRVNAVAVLADGRRAVIGGVNRRLELWDLEKRASLGVFDGHTAELTSVHFLEGARASFLSTSMDATAVFWRASERVPAKVLSPSSSRSRVFAGAVSPDQREAVTGTEDGSVQLWDTATWKVVDVIDLTPVHDFAVSAAFVDDHDFLVGTARGVILRFDRKSRRP